MKQIYTIPEENLESLQKKVKQINNKSLKLVGTPITLMKIEENFIQDEITKEWNKVIVVEINGEAPHYNGWEFVATLNHNYETGNIIKSAGQEVPVEYRTTPIKCDHCGINRFRKDTYVVKNTETNEYKQVGSSCLKDFFNGRDPHQVAKYAELLFDMEKTVNGCNGNSQPTKYINLKEYLNVVNECIKRWGFMSTSKANEIENQTGKRPLTTASEAYNHLFSSYILHNERIYPTKESEELVEEALQWIKNQPLTNDYMYNLSTVCANECIDHRGIGIAASLMPTYYRTKNEKIEKANKVESNFVGNPNEKIETQATLVKTYSFDSQYGTVVIHKFEDTNGNILIWKTGPRGLEENKNYKVKGTIKDCEEYKGEKQTQLTRCKIESA